MKNVLLRVCATLFVCAGATPALAHPGHDLDLAAVFTQPLHALQHFFEDLGIPVVLIIAALLGVLAWFAIKRIARAKAPKPATH